MFKYILAVILIAISPSLATAEVPLHPHKTLRYEVSSELGGQRKTVQDHRQERREMVDSHRMDEEKKEEIRQKIEERFGDLTPEERQAKLDELHKYRQMLHQELEQLPPEARMERMKELRAAYEKKGLAAFDDEWEEGPDDEHTE